jgi:hypothetical protein
MSGIRTFCTLEGALDFGRNVDSRDGFPQNLPRGWIVGHGVGIHGKIKPLSLDQLAVAHRVAVISAGDREHAILDGEFVNGNIEVLGCQLKQGVARGVNGHAKTAAAELRPG